jgi:GT2 family glycosyltransferase
MSDRPITAIVVAYNRIEMTMHTLRRIKACRPAPDEIIVHVDANNIECAEAVKRHFSDVRLLISQDPVGPGGGRNRLVTAACNELVASFDDDSYPIDSDYFERVASLGRIFPDAALLSASIVHRNEALPVTEISTRPTVGFGAGGVVFRRTEFITAGGFLPLVVAYGMEEEDLSLRLLDQGKKLLHCPSLRVFHDTDRSHHNLARITSGTIANIALLAWLRYPASYWPYGALQVVNRCFWCLRMGRRRGIASGLARIPGHLWKHRHLRAPVSPQAIQFKLDGRKYNPSSTINHSWPGGGKKLANSRHAKEESRQKSK